MVVSLVTLLFMQPDPAMLRQLDHVVFVVRDLPGAIDDYRRRGFTVTPGGEHVDRQTHNAVIPFADGSYLERSKD